MLCSATSTAARKRASISLIKSAAGWSETSKMFNQFYNRRVIDKNDVFGSIVFEREKNV